MKERITITVDTDLLTDVDKLVSSDSAKNRSHAFDMLLKKALGKRCPKTAVILCGGKGSRLSPITKEIPKPLIPVHGKPLIEHLLDLFKKYDIKDVLLAVGYRKQQIMDHFGDGTKYGISIRYIEEDEPLGTAGPLKKARHLLTETFIVTNGDELKDVNLEEFYQLHKQKKGRGTIALTTVSDPSKYGVVDLSGSKILNFVEKPEPGTEPSNLINSGLYILEPEVIDLIPDGFAMIEKDIFPKLAASQELFGYPFSGQWFDTGNIERYEKALDNWKGLSK
jgi:NDP-sugar pyrophosphorylase family protein